MALNRFRIRVGENWYTVEVGDLTRPPVAVTVEGDPFHVELEGLSSPTSTSPQTQPPGSRRGRRSTTNLEAPRAEGSFAAPSFSENILRSPMPGRVISILVRPGDQVTAGDEVCVVEAMKMEQSVRTHRDGIVKEVHVQPRDSVKADDPLVELE